MRARAGHIRAWMVALFLLIAFPDRKTAARAQLTNAVEWTIDPGTTTSWTPSVGASLLETGNNALQFDGGGPSIVNNGVNFSGTRFDEAYEFPQSAAVEVDIGMYRDTNTAPSLSEQDASFQVTFRVDAINIVGPSVLLEIGGPGRGTAITIGSDGFLLFNVDGGAANDQASVTSIAPLSVGEWYQVSATIDVSTGTLTMYLNGVFQDTQAVANGLITAWNGGGRTAIGRVGDGTAEPITNPQPFEGLIYSLNTWSGVMTPAEAASFAAQVSGSAAGGDPYFKGFDGVVFNFDGIPGTIFNLISSPWFQMNALFDIGAAEDPFPLYSMGTIVRKAGIRVLNHNVTFAVHIDGVHQVTVDGIVLEDGISLNDDTCTIEYRNGLDVAWKAKGLSMQPHRVHARTSIRTFQLEVEVLFAQLVVNGQYVFDFIDFDVALLDGGFCPEGIWGRSACHQDLRPLQPAAYEVHDGILGVEFSKNQFTNC